MPTTRERLITEGMRLFGQQGYAATTVAQIEEAAGLSPGSGSLYKHFRSKQALLEAGLDRLLRTDHGIPHAASSRDPADLHTELAEVVRAGLARLQVDRDVNRLLFRGLDAFPDLLQRFGEKEIAQIHQGLAALLADMAGPTDESVDWPAVALALQGATAHYWLLADVFGEHPTGVSEERFVAALAELAAAFVAQEGVSKGARGGS